MNSPTVRQMATNKSLWEEHVDPDNNDPNAFDRMAICKKMEMIVELWPKDVDEDDKEAMALLK